MRIVSVCRRYGEPGGMENVVHDRAEELRALGHDVFILNSSDGQYSAEFAAHCVDQCTRLAPDVVHLDSYDAGRPWWVDRPGNPRVIACTLHSNPWSSFFSKWNLWRHGRASHPGMSYVNAAAQCDLMRSFDVVIGISRHECRLLRDMCGVWDAWLVYNPIAPYFFDKPTVPLPDGAPWLHVGTNAARGVDVARAACELAGVELRIVTGVPREAMVAVYDECCGLLLPTFRSDGYDLTVAEASARGRPVVAGATGACATECMYTVPLGDAEALAAELRAEPACVMSAEQHEPRAHALAWLEAVGC